MRNSGRCRTDQTWGNTSIWQAPRVAPDLRVAIVLTGQAYLPEAWAYHRHLIAKGCDARVVNGVDEACGADLAISFSLSQHRTLHRMGVPAIHEYHSLSCGRWRLAKDLVKRLAAPPAVGRIFSDEHIAQRMRFGSGRQVLIRPMGFDAAIAGCAAACCPPTHDNVYCGTFDRPGVADFAGIVYACAAHGVTAESE